MFLSHNRQDPWIVLSDEHADRRLRWANDETEHRKAAVKGDDETTTPHSGAQTPTYSP
jgi:hypothetical protein